MSPTSLSDILSPPVTDAAVSSGSEGDALDPTPAPAPTPSAQPAPTAETPTDPAEKPAAEQPFWYRKEIEKERKARQAAERRAAELEAARQPRSEVQQRPQIDPLEDPEAYTRFIESRFEHQRLVDRLERSEERFIDKLGDKTFEQTREWLATRPDIEEWALKQRDPWKAAHGQFQKERLAAEIGEDPNAWREAERERLKAEILAEQQAAAQAAPASPPNMRPRPPAPATDVRGSAPRDAAGRFAGPTPMSDILGSKGR